MNLPLIMKNFISWVFGILVFAIGILNILWGNDQAVGAFLLLLSFVFFPPANIMFEEATNFSIPGWMKIILGIAILVGALGVGELFPKLDMMIDALRD